MMMLAVVKQFNVIDYVAPGFRTGWYWESYTHSVFRLPKKLSATLLSQQSLQGTAG
jgi:hypothetical protein